MSFNAYIANIEAKTGKTPADFKALAETMDFMDGPVLKSGVKAGLLIDWLKRDFDLGHGHSMAIYALLRGIKTPDAKSARGPTQTESDRREYGQA